MIFTFQIAFLEISWVDFIDISLVAILLYQVYKLIHGSIAANIFLGILALYFVYLIVRAAQMELLTNILGQFMGIGMLAALILFQQEIRKFLLVIGKSTEVNKSTLIKPFTGWRYETRYHHDITEVMEAVTALKAMNTGALIVFSRESELKFYVETGDPINATISCRLLISIFNKNSPLHDGAVIIQKGRIKAARCILPVTENQNLPAYYGLRHRSAIGMSEYTHSMVLAISEETGNLIVARNGMYINNLSLDQAKRKILEYLENRESKKWNTLE